MTNEQIEIALISMFLISGYTIRGVIDVPNCFGVIAEKGETQARVLVTRSEREQNSRRGMYDLLTHRMRTALGPVTA